MNGKNDPKTDRKIVRLYTRENYPLSMREIAEEVGCCENTVRNRLRAKGVEIRPKGGMPGRPSVTRINVDSDVIDMRKAGFSTNYIAETLNICPTTVRRRLRDNGYKPMANRITPSRIPRIEVKQVEFLYSRMDMTYEEISENLGLSRQQVRIRLMKSSIRKRTRSEISKKAWETRRAA